MGALGVLIWQKAEKRRGWVIGAVVVVLIALVTLPTMFLMAPAQSSGGVFPTQVVVQTQVVAGEVKEIIVTAVPAAALGRRRPASGAQTSVPAAGAAGSVQVLRCRLRRRWESLER